MPFCLLYVALGAEKEKAPKEKKTETDCIVGAHRHQGPRAAPERQSFLNAQGKFWGKG